MSAQSPSTWISWLAGTAAIYDASISVFSSPHRFLTVGAFAALYLLANYWRSQVTSIVPEPYLDEVFHIPQAEAYCEGSYEVWDPKLTTPAGLYIFATLFIKHFAFLPCSVAHLRFLNIILSIFILSYLCDCHALIHRPPSKGTKSDKSSKSTATKESSSIITLGTSNLSPYTLHTALNIALFPPLFFFTGLFYTDVLSTCIVVRMFKCYLEKDISSRRSQVDNVYLYLWGVLALWMRQTNVFWVGLFMGGLEIVRMLESIQRRGGTRRDGMRIEGSWRERLEQRWQNWIRGAVHDVALRDAGFEDFLLTPLSIVVAAAHRPLLLLNQIWPYIAIMLSFLAFIIWNGGVVMGDKSNHIATLHLPQLLYLSTTTVFFSLPILIPSAFSLLSTILHHLPLPFTPPQFLILPNASLAPKRLLLPIALIAATTLATIAVVHLNTIIHPFTLADNRHYVFYAFRYTILRHPWVRYLLTPVYLVCGWLCYTALFVESGIRSGDVLLHASNTNAGTSPKENTETSDIGASRKQETEFEHKTKQQQQLQQQQQQQEDSIDPGMKVSWLINYLLPTTLSLITAPLVEPRYYILPWIYWRLYLPSPSQSSSPSASASSKQNPISTTTDPKTVWNTHKYLIAETLWFGIINVVTGYIFLYRGFEWVQEAGRVQRFLW